MAKEAAFVIMYALNGEQGIDNEIVLVKQYRDKSDRKTLEAPGGQIEDDESPLKAALREVEEETGIKLPAKRLNYLGPRFKRSSSDSMAYAFSCRLRPKELEKIRNKAKKGKSYGADKNEETYIKIVKLRAITINDTVIDWNTMGMILHAFHMDPAFP